MRYADAEIVGLEPSPRLFRCLAANVAGLPNVTVHHAAVGVGDAPVTFYEGTASWAGSTLADQPVQRDSAVTVAGLALDDLLAPGVDLMKIDIEGGEFEVLPVSSRLADVRTIIGEIHAPPGSEEVRQLLALLPGREIETTPLDPAWPAIYTVFSAVRQTA